MQHHLHDRSNRICEVKKRFEDRRWTVNTSRCKEALCRNSLASPSFFLVCKSVGLHNFGDTERDVLDTALCTGCHHPQRQRLMPLMSVSTGPLICGDARTCPTHRYVCYSLPTHTRSRHWICVHALPSATVSSTGLGGGRGRSGEASESLVFLTRCVCMGALARACVWTGLMLMLRDARQYRVSVKCSRWRNGNFCAMLDVCNCLVHAFARACLRA